MPLLYEDSGIPQHIKTPIPSGAGPDTYSKKSLGFDGSSFLVGGIIGFVVGGLILTATGKQVVGATARRATSYIEPKRY